MRKQHKYNKHTKISENERLRRYQQKAETHRESGSVYPKKYFS